MAYEVKILADSVNLAGVRLVTWELTYPRFVHAELMTHRRFSRSSASLRAIPVKKMLARIENDPVIPIKWLKNQAGMQGFEELNAETGSFFCCRSQGDGEKILDLADITASSQDSEGDVAERVWRRAARESVAAAQALDMLGVHKGIVNRLVEPWMWITIIMSTTHHANWFALRDHPMAEIHLQKFAAEMHAQYWNARPKYVRPGAVHTPLMEDMGKLVGEGFSEDDLTKIAVGRCARVSYLNHDGVRDPREDIALHDKLRSASPPHMAPFEHVATSMADSKVYGNFHGWKQIRHELPNEAGPPEPLFTQEGDCLNYDSVTRRCRY